MFEILAFVGTVAVLAALSLSGIGRSILAPTAVEHASTVDGSILERSATGQARYIKAEDCSKLVVVAYKETAVTGFKEPTAIGESPVIASAVPRADSSTGACVYSMKLPADASVVLSVKSARFEPGALGVPGSTPGDATAPVPEQKGQREIKSTASTLFVKGEYKAFKVLPAVQSVPLFVDVSEIR